MSSQSVADNIVNLVRQYNFDGVSIEFNDYHAAAKGTASVWLE